MLDCRCSLVCYAPRGLESLKDKGICFLKGWGWGRVGLSPHNQHHLLFWRRRRSCMWPWEERRGNVAHCSDCLYVSPDCEGLPQAFTMAPIVCLWEKARAFLSPWSLVFGMGEISTSRGWRKICVVFFLSSFPPHYWHFCSHLKAQNFTQHLKKQCFGNGPLSSSMNRLFPWLFVIHSVETIKWCDSQKL